MAFLRKMRPGAPVCVSRGNVHTPHIYTLTHIYTCTHAHTLIQIRTLTRAHILTYIYTRAHTYMYTQVCAHMQMCMEHTHTHIHTEHTPGLAGPRPGAEPLTPHPLTPGPLTLSKHILQEATPREDTGALPRHAGAHLRGVPAGAQALASALRLSFFSSPSAATRLVTFSP